MQLSTATVTDISLLTSLLHAFYAEEPGLHAFSEKEALDRARKILEQSGNGLFPLLLKNGDSVTGYALISTWYSNEFGGLMALLDELFIAPEHRGAGLGGKAMEALKTWAVTNGLRGISLEVTDADVQVRRLYERHGFIAVPRKTMHWFPRGGQ